MKSIQEVEDEIRSVFAGFASQDDKWGYLLKLAREHPGMDPALRDEKFLVSGCASKMFLVPEFADGVLHLHMDTEVGAANPLMFVVLLVGTQGLVEAAVCGVLGGIVSKAVDAFLKRT